MVKVKKTIRCKIEASVLIDTVSGWLITAPVFVIFKGGGSC